MTETLVGVSPPSSKEPKEPSGTGPSYGELEAARELVRAARDKGGSLTASDGLLKARTKTVIETALEEEMSDHLGYDRHEPVGRNRGNSRNGKRSKTVLTDAAGEVDIDVPRDRDGSFEPVIVAKRQRRLSDVDAVVLSLYAKGLTTGEISAHFAEVYGASVSKDTVSRITDRVIEEMQAWWARPLESVRVCPSSRVGGVGMRRVSSTYLESSHRWSARCGCRFDGLREAGPLRSCFGGRRGSPGRRRRAWFVWSGPGFGASQMLHRG